VIRSNQLFKRRVLSMAACRGRFAAADIAAPQPGDPGTLGDCWAKRLVVAV